MPHPTTGLGWISRPAGGTRSRRKSCDRNAYGLWALVVVNTALFIAFAVSFLRPSSARDWKLLGGFSAFVVALFVKMYGVPLTVYFLSGWVGSRFELIDLSHAAGHLWNDLIGWRWDPHLSPFHLMSYVFIGGASGWWQPPGRCFCGRCSGGSWQRRVRMRRFGIPSTRGGDHGRLFCCSGRPSRRLSCSRFSPSSTDDWHSPRSGLPPRNSGQRGRHTRLTPPVVPPLRAVLNLQHGRSRRKRSSPCVHRVVLTVVVPTLTYSPSCRPYLWRRQPEVA